MNFYEARKRADVQNGAALLKHLATLCVVSMTLDYSGSGDEGNIEEITFFGANEKQLHLDGQMIEVVSVLSTKAKNGVLEYELIPGTERDLENEVLDFGDRVLSNKYDGWENDSGARGSVTINLHDRTVLIEHNQVIKTTAYFESSFPLDPLLAEADETQVVA